MKISDSLLKKLPKVELHCHLDGSLRIETILDLAQRHHVSLPSSDASGLRKPSQLGKNGEHWKNTSLALT